MLIRVESEFISLETRKVALNFLGEGTGITSLDVPRAYRINDLRFGADGGKGWPSEQAPIMLTCVSSGEPSVLLFAADFI